MQFDQINSSVIKNAIAEAMNPEKPEEEGSVSSDSDDEALSKKKVKGDKKKDKNLGGLPRKSFKKLIKKELGKQCQQIFNDMMNMKELSQNEEQNEDLAIIHQNITCDGCGQSPIIGIRYKCSVCKNLDYCTMCEERKGHEHALLKIYKPNQCPKVMCGRGGRYGQANAHGQPQGVNPMEAIGSFFRGIMHNHGHHNNGAHVFEEYKGHKDSNWRNK